jgi:predicted NBD/HSP70 family sugar kinase
LEYANGSLDEFINKLNSNEKGAVQLFEEYMRNLAIMITNLRVTLDCDIIIGGDIRKCLDRKLSRLIQLVDEEDKYMENHDYLSLAYYDDIGSAVGVAELGVIEFVNK